MVKFYFDRRDFIVEVIEQDGSTLLDFDISQIYESKKILESRLGTLVSSFSYPFGRIPTNNKEIIDIIKFYGYDVAVTARFSRFNSYKNRYLLNRIAVTKRDSCESFKRKLKGYDDWREWKIRAKLKIEKI